MSINILRLAALLYAAGAAAYVLFFARPRHRRAATVGFTLVAIGFAVHAASIGLACREFGGTEFFNLRGGFGMLGWIAAGTFLLLQRTETDIGRGASSGSQVAVELVAKIFGDLKGRAVLLVGAGKMGALFSRLPSLDALDRLNQRLVRIGFAVFSVGLVTGALVAKNAWGSFWMWDPQQIAFFVVWLLYGGMVQLRHVGVHGRRYALLTLAGFALVLGSMLALGAVPNLTRHGGSFQ